MLIKEKQRFVIFATIRFCITGALSQQLNHESATTVFTKKALSLSLRTVIQAKSCSGGQ